jgi:CheY-like chemotaxis protein
MEISVIDTGVGVSKDSITSIFDSFVQADVSVSRRYGGSGLGLSISRRLCELMGGSIDLESIQGEGTKVTFTLPLEEAMAPQQARQPEADPAPSPAQIVVRGKRILLVEDVDINQELIAAMLTRFECEVEVVDNGAEALDLMRASGADSCPCDLILMDLQMPVMDGLTATRAIRALGGRASTIPIVALSAAAFDDDVKECLASGMNDHVSKPVALADLQAALSHWLGSKVDAGPPPEQAEKSSLAQRFEARRQASAKRLHELAGALAGTDSQTMQPIVTEARQIAHSMAGVAGMFGHPELGDLANDVDRALGTPCCPEVPGESARLAVLLSGFGDAVLSGIIPHNRRPELLPSATN